MMRPRCAKKDQACSAYLRARKMPAIAVAACAIASSVFLPVSAFAASSSADLANARTDSRIWGSFFEKQRPLPAVSNQRVIVSFKSPSLAEWEAAGKHTLTPKQRKAWVEKALAAQQERIDAMAAEGVQFQIEHRYVRVINAVSIVLHGNSGELLRKVDGIEQITRVRNVWPMATKGDDLGAVGAAKVAGVEDSGSKVKVAVLDAPIDASHAAINGKAVAAFDATTDKDRASFGDGHGTSVAGAVLQGSGDKKDQLQILPVTVMKQHVTYSGEEDLIGSSDDVIAGLEYVVDPNADGDFSDAADVALIALGTPFASFANSPEAKAVAGTSGLGPLVVAAAGNDGSSGALAGTMSSFAARDALTVGAVDARRTIPAASISVKGDGIDTKINALSSLLAYKTDVDIIKAPVTMVDGKASEVTDYLDEQLQSRVSGAVVLIKLDPRVLISDQIRAAADTGARAVIVGAPSSIADASGTIDVRGANIPAIAISYSDAENLHKTLEEGSDLSISVGFSDQDNPSFGQIAGFNSTGPRINAEGGVDVLAPGVGMTVAGNDGKYRTVSGTSIAAAWVAGEAAVLAMDHKDWDAPKLRSALIDTSNLLGENKSRPHVSIQGGGVVSAKNAANSDWAFSEGRIDFGSIVPGSSAEQNLALQSLSGAASAAGIGNLKVLVDDGGSSSQASLALVDNKVVLSVPDDAKDSVIGGWLVLSEQGIHIPWTAVISKRDNTIVPMRAELSKSQIRPAVGPGAIATTMRLSIGASSSGVDDDALAISAVDKLDLVLLNSLGKEVGVIGSLDAVLPGVYDFGITARDTLGKKLKPGKWQIAVRYVSANTSDKALKQGPVLSFQVIS